MVQVHAPRTIRYIFVNLTCHYMYFMLYLCFETFYFYFYFDPRHLIFEKNCRKPRNIKSLALLCMRLQAVLILVIWEISPMSLNIEASRVSFLNQSLLQIENYIKMDNLPSNAMFRYVLVFSERKWLYLSFVWMWNVKHEFGFFKTCICFRTEATTC